MYEINKITAIPTICNAEEGHEMSNNRKGKLFQSLIHIWMHRI